EGRQWQRRGRRGPQLCAEGGQDRGRRGRGGALPVRAERGHLALRGWRRGAPAGSAGRAAGERAALRHERLLLAPQGAGAHLAPEPQGEQGGDPPARHRLHQRPAVGAELRIRSRDPRGPWAARPGSAQHPQWRDQRPGGRGEVLIGAL
ncbi:DNA-binding protein inhibitor ID-1 isoform b, partial [Daubentonia madagascariensis]